MSCSDTASPLYGSWDLISTWSAFHTQNTCVCRVGHSDALWHQPWISFCMSHTCMVFFPVWSILCLLRQDTEYHTFHTGYTWGLCRGWYRLRFDVVFPTLTVVIWFLSCVNSRAASTVFPHLAKWNKQRLILHETRFSPEDLPYRALQWYGFSLVWFSWWSFI